MAGVGAPEVKKAWSEAKKGWLVHSISKSNGSISVEFRGRFESSAAADDEANRAKQGYAPKHPSKHTKPSSDEALAQLIQPPEQLMRARRPPSQHAHNIEQPAQPPPDAHQPDHSADTLLAPEQASTPPAAPPPLLHHLGALTESDVDLLRELAAKATGDYTGVVFNEDRGNWVAHCANRTEGPYSTPHDAAWAHDCIAFEAGVVNRSEPDPAAVNFPELLQRKAESGSPCRDNEHPSASLALPSVDAD
jgi:hypothetical protein